MMIDASALVATILDEPEAKAFSTRIEEARLKVTHPISVYEAVLAVARSWRRTVAQAQGDVTSFLVAAEIAVVPIDAAEASAALSAHERYGRGRHPAALNMGDCLSYAVAKLRGMPLLYKGDDFAKTDLA